jgi:hypothetical protein
MRNIPMPKEKCPIEIILEIIKYVIRRKDHRTFFQCCLISMQIYKKIKSLGSLQHYFVRYKGIHRPNYSAFVPMLPNGIIHGTYEQYTSANRSSLICRYEYVNGNAHGSFIQYFSNLTIIGKLWYNKRYDEFSYYRPDGTYLYSEFYDEFPFEKTTNNILSDGPQDTCKG